MKKTRDERGYALLMVMLLMVLFTILGLGLLATNINASKQTSNKEQQVQARHFAEMGVLHYKAEINGSHKVEEGKEEEFCGELESISSRVVTDNYEILSAECSVEDERITLSFTSKGDVARNATKIIEATLSFEQQEQPPSIPTKPEVPSNPNRVWPTCPDNNINGQACVATEFSVIPNAEMKKGDWRFKDHLIVDTLQKIENGTKANLTIEGDLYVEDFLDIKNHACIVIQGNLTVKEKIVSDNKVFIFVYGDANLPSSIESTSVNNGIYVRGDVYINGTKEPNAYKPFPVGDTYHSCSLEEPPITWSLTDEIEAVYH